MARRTRNTDTTDLERDDPLIASLAAPVVPARPLVPLANTPLAETLFDEIEDRRTFHPDDQFRQPLNLAAAPADFRRSSSPARTFQSDHARFDHPKSVLLCVRRKQRREVIFAKRKRKKGAGAKRRRNYFSNVRC